LECVIGIKIETPFKGNELGRMFSSMHIPASRADTATDPDSTSKNEMAHNPAALMKVRNNIGSKLDTC
jgi:hypothetical protein